MKLDLTKRQLEVLTNHWHRNMNYGYEGTFGGYDDDKELKKEMDREYKIAETIMKKLLTLYQV